MRKTYLVFTMLILRTAIMAQPCGMSLVTLSTYTSSCGTCNSSIWMGQTGGTPPFTWSWSTGQTTDSIIGLCPGVYICTITDSVNCTSTATLTITSPPGPSISFTSTDATCDSCCDATATANVSGGTPPFTYLWSDNQTGSTDTGLCVAKFICCVTDAAGCTTCDTVEILSATGIREVRSTGNDEFFYDAGMQQLSFRYSHDISILDLNGRVVLFAQRTSSLSVSHLPEGMYICRISDTNSGSSGVLFYKQ